MRLRAATCLAMACALMLAACATSNISFRTDKRVKIVRPHDRADVTPPFTLQWTVRDFPVGPGTIGSENSYFAVFVDRRPMAPGKDLRALGDDACKRLPGCPDETWLADHRVFLTADTSLRIEALPDLLPSTTRAGTKEDHEITIVLMHGNRRIGEAAFAVEFFRRIER
jgi:hypothetical protein